MWDFAVCAVCGQRLQHDVGAVCQLCGLPFCSGACLENHVRLHRLAERAEALIHQHQLARAREHAAGRLGFAKRSRKHPPRPRRARRVFAVLKIPQFT